MKRRTRPQTPDLFTPTCADCGAALVVTESGFLCCPRGHGKLFSDPAAAPPDPEPCGLWFVDEPTAA